MVHEHEKKCKTAIDKRSKKLYDLRKMAETPSYKSRLRLGSLRQTTKKMMVTKASGSKVGDTTLKKFLKEDKGLRRMAYGEKTSTVESWKGRHFIKQAKEDIKQSGQVRESVYGKKTSAEREFRDTVKAEIREDVTGNPQGPSKKELEKQKRVDEARKEFHQFERAREVERESGKLAAGALGGDTGAPSAAQTKPTASASSKPMTLAHGGGAIGGASKSSSTQIAPTSSIGGNSQGSVTAGPLPSVFGIRGRVLRIEGSKSEIIVHVLNAPAELAIFIGRERRVQVPQAAHCWKDRHAVACNDIVVGDHVDIRGKILNKDFVADEIYVNQGELPDFVVHLGQGEQTIELPTTPPDDLAIG